MITYHIGILAGDKLPYGARRRKRKTLYLQAVESVDFLSCDIWLYLGERQTTKAQLQRNSVGILDAINKAHHTDYESLVVE